MHAKNISCRHTFLHNFRKNLFDSPSRNRVEDTEDETFADGGKDCDMRFSHIEKLVSMLDERTCYSRSFFRSVND